MHSLIICTTYKGWESFINSEVNNCVSISQTSDKNMNFICSKLSWKGDYSQARHHILQTSRYPLPEQSSQKKTLFTGRPATIHRCTGTSRYFLPRYEYHILNKLSRYLRYIYICINKHGKALSAISAHPTTF